MYSNPHKNDPAGATPQAPQSPKIPASTYIVYVPLVVNASVSVSVLLLFLYTFFALVFTFLFLRAKIAINNEVLKIAFILKLRYRYPKSR